MIPCGSTTLPELMKNVLLPNLSRVIFDRSALVRKQLAHTIAFWLEHIDDVSKDFESQLFPLFVSGLVDASPDVQSETLELLLQLSVPWAADPANVPVDEHDHGDSNHETQAMHDSSSTCVVPFTCRPPKGARWICRRYEDSVFFMHLCMVCLFVCMHPLSRCFMSW